MKPNSISRRGLLIGAATVAASSLKAADATTHPMTEVVAVQPVRRDPWRTDHS